ncbi:ubiquinone biosynthesis O-methyltransferase-like [Schistocerca gregaria]|uniref:ubiquinone biosynthesis O-methyltransferase-like n=1 Tax=Schistocerca gregaria TaxID=7010 RepID=UPI00211E334A|nr:ubiquinone biosynthesis O-methyltransferase-like [Schistocerca gregaria]
MEKQDVYIISVGKPDVSNLACASLTFIAAKQIDALWSDLTWPKRPLPLLEIGCGTGDVATKVTAARLPPCTKLVACDTSSKKLEFCRLHNALPGTIVYEELNVFKPDLQNSAVWQYAPFGKVFCLMLLHWVPDNRHAIQNIHKLLVPGGEVVFSITANMLFSAAFEDIAKDSRWSEHMQDLKKFIFPYEHCEDPLSEFSQLLKSEGLQVLRCYVAPQRVLFPSKVQHTDFLKSVYAFLDCIPEDQKDAFLDDWMQRSEKLKRLSKDVGRSENPKFYSNLNIMVAVTSKL